MTQSRATRGRLTDYQMASLVLDLKLSALDLLRADQIKSKPKAALDVSEALLVVGNGDFEL